MLELLSLMPLRTLLPIDEAIPTPVISITLPAELVILTVIVTLSPVFPPHEAETCEHSIGGGVVGGGVVGGGVVGGGVVGGGVVGGGVVGVTGVTVGPPGV